MREIIVETLLDGLKLLPFLFLAFFIIEYIEHKLSKKSKKIITKAGKFGPFFGSLLGLFPQCGFSVMATNLYVTRIITLGTLISIYLTTSDEMLPILLSHNTDMGLIFKILLVKLIVGIIAGFIIDLILRKRKVSENANYDICDSDHCDCEHGIFLSAIKHTLNTFLFILAISFILNIVMEYAGDALSNTIVKNSILSPFIASLIGLIPNCGSSVVLTELYISGVLSLSSVIGGLLTGSGVALLVLFKSNKNIKENITILGIIYFVGVLSGIILSLLNIF